MNRFKTFTLVAAVSMLATVACKKDEKKDEPAPAKTADTTATDTADKPDEKPADPAADPAATGDAKPDAMATIDGMIAECGKSEEARAARQAAKPLYERLGGRESLEKFTHRVLDLHKENPPIQAMFTGDDYDQAKQDNIVKHFVDYVGAGTGGPEKYTGRDMAELHHPMNLTAEQVLAAGGDIMKALEEFKVPAEESEEVMCIILAHKDALIKPADAAAAGDAADEAEPADAE